MCAMPQRLLRRAAVRLLASPNPQRRLLNGAAKENVRAHGSGDVPVFASTCIAFNRAEASSPDWPPDKTLFPELPRERLEKAFHCGGCDLIDRFLVRTAQSRRTCWASESFLPAAPPGNRVARIRSADSPRHFTAPLEGMIAVHQHFRFDHGTRPASWANAA